MVFSELGTLSGVILDSSDSSDLFSTDVDGRKLPQTSLEKVINQFLYRKLWVVQHRYAVSEHVPMSQLLTDSQLQLIADYCPCVEWEVCDLVGFEASIMWSPVLLPVIWDYLRGLRK